MHFRPLVVFFSFPSPDVPSPTTNMKLSHDSMATLKMHDYGRNGTGQYATNVAEMVRDTIQVSFDWYCQWFGREPIAFDTLGAMCLTMGVFWSLGLLYLLLDLCKRPHFLYKYKTQDEEVTWAVVARTVKLCLFNQLTVQLATSIGFHYLGRVRGMDSSVRVPALGTILYHLAAMALIQEVTFYYAHRLLHVGSIYRYIHKVHHYWQAPIAIAAIYCHPLEHFFANLLPVLLGPMVLGSHRAVTAIWLIIVHVFTLNDHSGYHFPLMPSPEFHDYHHLKFNQNFGRMGFLDYLHGTSERYNKSTQAKRDKLLLSLRPMKELIPEEGKGTITTTKKVKTK